MAAPAPARAPALPVDPRSAAHAAPRPLEVPAPERRPLEIVEPSTWKRQRLRHRRMLIIISATAALLFGQVAFHVFVMQSQLEIDGLTTRIAEQQRSNEQLRLDAARLSSPDLVVEQAKTVLGMVEPEVVTYLHVPSPRSSTPPAPSEGRSDAPAD